MMFCTIDSFMYVLFFFFFNDTATTEIYTLSLHDALPIWTGGVWLDGSGVGANNSEVEGPDLAGLTVSGAKWLVEERSEEHTSELQSRQYLVCRLLLEKKKKNLKLFTSYYDTRHYATSICI